MALDITYRPHMKPFCLTSVIGKVAPEWCAGQRTAGREQGKQRTGTQKGPLPGPFLNEYVVLRLVTLGRQLHRQDVLRRVAARLNLADPPLSPSR